ncbi:MAG: [Eubacterium sp.]|nr:[FeFe] hydrogenase H-cluster radical SAM maturase HydE [Eubacterium sp.]
MYKKLIDKLEKETYLTKEEYLALIKNRDKCRDYLSQKAFAVKEKNFGNKIYIRGLVEISNYCKNNCFYCGIRRDNENITRFRLSKEEILSCCKKGYALGFRTFVLQGGEDAYYTDGLLCEIIREIKRLYPDCAVTLSLGERSYESYKALKKAGADRYLLRHETCNRAHYEKLHPKEMSFDNRLRCIEELKALGYQTGVGFMVGSPYQSEDDLAEELVFLKRIEPQMVGIGPFLTHRDTPFRDFKNGTAELTTFMLSLIRLTLPNVLLPSTTALATVDPFGREAGILAGANVIMPNLSPVSTREKYALYDNKVCTGEEAAQCISCVKLRMEKINQRIVIEKGDYKDEL